MHRIHWPADYMPGTTEHFVSSELIAQGLYSPLSEPRCP
jgi:hypothetical protein